MSGCLPFLSSHSTRWGVVVMFAVVWYMPYLLELQLASTPFVFLVLFLRFLQLLPIFRLRFRSNSELNFDSSFTQDLEKTKRRGCQGWGNLVARFGSRHKKCPEEGGHHPEKVPELGEDGIHGHAIVRPKPHQLFNKVRVAIRCLIG